jgi:hypothetical protein
MPKTLVVVESPAKAKTIEKYLGPEFSVRASYGHIRDLPKSDLGVDVEDDFEVTYEVPEDSKKHVTALKQARKGTEDLVLATDYDREGEAIAYHVATLLDVDPEVAKRVTFTEIPPGPGPAGRLQDLADPVAPGPAGALGRPGPVRGRPPDRRARARDPGVPAGRALEHRGTRDPRRRR